MRRTSGRPGAPLLALPFALLPALTLAEADASGSVAAAYVHHDNLLFVPDPEQAVASREVVARGSFSAAAPGAGAQVTGSGWVRRRDFDDARTEDVLEHRLMVKPQVVGSRTAVSLRAAHERLGIYGSEIGDVSVPALTERTRRSLRPAWVATLGDDLLVEVAATWRGTRFSEPEPSARVDARYREASVTLNRTLAPEALLGARLSFADWESRPGTVLQLGRRRPGNDVSMDIRRLEVELSGPTPFADKAGVMLGGATHRVRGDEPEARFVGVTPEGGLVFRLTRRDVSRREQGLVWNARTQHRFAGDWELRLGLGGDRYPDSTGALRRHTRAEASLQWQASARAEWRATATAVHTAADDATGRPELDDYLLAARWRFRARPGVTLEVGAQHRVRISPAQERTTASQLRGQVQVAF